MRAIRTCQWVDEDGACDHMVEGNTDYCGSHNAAMRKAERESFKEKKVYKIPKQTKKRAAQTREYIKLEREYLECHPCCEVRDCYSKSTEVHHMAGRENDKLVDVNFFMAVCNPCHTKITIDSAWAIEQGYSVKRSV